MYTTPPRALLKNDGTTLFHAGLVPAAKVYIGFNDAKQQQQRQQSPSSDAVLLQSTLSLMDKHALSLIQERAAESNAQQKQEQERGVDREGALLQHRRQLQQQQGDGSNPAGPPKEGKKPSWFKM